MTTKPSNTYADKLLGEHPLAMWSFDDDVYYISLIADSTRNIATWTTNSTATVASVSDSTAPFPTNYITEITGTKTPTIYADGYSFLSSNDTFTSTSGTFTLSFYLKTQYRVALSAGFGTGLSATISTAVPNVSSGTVSYVTYTTTTNHGFSNGDYIQVSGNSVDVYDTAGVVSNKTNNTFRIYFSPPSGQGNSTGGTALSAKTQNTYINPADYPDNSWIPVSFTFSDSISNQKILLGFSYGELSPKFYINGLTIGKDSEPFNGEFLGQSVSTIPTSIATTLTNGIETKSYGTEEYSAYHIATATELYSKNSGMSLSNGSEKSMRVYPHATSGQPSFIFPGFGMLNDIGRYKTLTLETLIRINANNSTPKKIIGPISSTDGIYITKDIISLKIGDSLGHYHLSEMFRPMILQFQIGDSFATLSIDGQKVIDLLIDNATLSLPLEYNTNIPAQNQDWFGIYAYSDIPLIEVGSISIFPYRSSDVLARLNLIYAQAVTQVGKSDFSSSDIISMDFGLSNYINNYNYPSFQANWAQATAIENLDILNENALSIKQYQPAAPSTSLYDSDKLFLDLYQTYIASGETTPFINLKPSTVVSGSGRSWSANQGYLYVNLSSNDEFLSNCLYGVFKSIETSATEQVLIKISSLTNENYLKISLINTTVSYKFKYGSASEITLATASITQGTQFAVGFNFQSLSAYSSDIASFLSNKTNLYTYVGGQSITANTFSGNIYKVGFCTTRNSSNILSLFNVNGILSSPSAGVSTFLSRTASYTVNALNVFNKIILDIGTSSYWQDYVPLSKLAKPALDSFGNKTLTLDFVQLNVDYDEPKTYSSNNFSTTNSLVKTYISFQTLSSGVSKESPDFTTTIPLSKNRVIDASTFSSTTKYEFVNGTVVYPPSNVDLSTLALVVHVEINIDGCNLKPIKLRFLEIAAQSFNKNFANEIGTKYTTSLYPYSLDNSISNKETTYPYDYNSKNPYLVYKETSPHLYLTRHSGVRIIGNLAATTSSNRGLFANIGNLSPDKRIVSMQMSIMADFDAFSNGQIIFILKTSSGYLEFKTSLLSSDTTKAAISTDSSISVSYYLNGKKVGKPVIKLNEWNVIGISFVEPLDISNTQGRLFLTSNILINDIYTYYANPTEVDQKASSILWSQINSNKWRIPVPTQTPTRSGNSITISTTGNHNLVVGEPIYFYDIVPNSYGIAPAGQTLKVSAIPTTTSFVYQNSNASTSAISTAGSISGTWQYLSIPNYYELYGNNAKNAYQSFCGTSKTVIDTDNYSKKLMLDGYEYIVYTDVSFDTITLDIA